MESDRPGEERDVLASPLRDTDFVARSATLIRPHDETASSMWGTLRSPTFSIVAGITLPIACFAHEPVLLSDDASMPPVLRWINDFWLLAYGIIGLEMLVLAVRLAIGTRLGAWNGLVAGVLFAGAPSSRERWGSSCCRSA